jgi:hypothetical protein
MQDDPVRKRHILNVTYQIKEGKWSGWWVYFRVEPFLESAKVAWFLSRKDADKFVSDKPNAE